MYYIFDNIFNMSVPTKIIDYNNTNLSFICMFDS